MTAKQLMLPAHRAFDSDGAPEAGATAHLYNTGTLTPALFYEDAALTISLGSTITANAAGRFDPMPYQDSATAFRIIIEDALGNVLDDIDPFYFGLVQGVDAAASVGLASRSLLAALPIPAVGTVRYIYEAGRQGFFRFDTSNLSTLVAADTAQGIYVPPASDATGASGAWVRHFSGPIEAAWFGAKGDGVTDDSAALGALSSFINALGGGTVALSPRATYIVGAQTLHTGNQTSGYSFPPDVLYPLEFNSCTKPVILRGNGATIKAKVGAKFGTFNDDGTSKGTVAPYTGGGLATPYQAMVYAHDCTAPIHIEDLELDGNLANLTIGGQYGDTGIQIPCVGLELVNNAGPTTCRNIISHHHALDGSMISGPATADTAAREQGIVQGCHSYCNGRSNLSLTGGKGWTFLGCSFNYAGKATSGSDTAGVIQSNPNAGVDLEAEAGKVVRDASFEDCEFIGNSGAGLLSDNTNVNRVSVRRCTIIGTTNYSMWPRSPRFVFEDCLIMGAMTGVYGNADPALSGKFIRCHFNHDLTLSPTGALYQTSVAAAMWDPGVGGIQNVLFDTCTIESEIGSPIFGSTPSGPGDDSCHFYNCRFLVSNPSGTVGLAVYGRFSGEKTHFAGVNSIPDASFPATHPWCSNAGIALDSYLFENSFAGGGAPVPLTRMKATISRESMTKLYYGSATFDPPSLALGAKSAIQTMAVLGTNIGDKVEDTTFSVDLAGARIHAWVSGAGTVSYYFINENGTDPLDLVSGTVSVTVRAAT